MKEDVAGLEVPMHNVSVGEHLECLEYLGKVDKHLGLRQRPTFFNLLFECALVTELVEEVEVVGCFQDLDELYDVRGLRHGEDLNLVESALFQFWVLSELADVNDFDCYFPLGFGVDAPVDLAVLTLTYLLVESVVLYYLHHSNQY